MVEDDKNPPLPSGSTEPLGASLRGDEVTQVSLDDARTSFSYCGGHRALDSSHSTESSKCSPLIGYYTTPFKSKTRNCHFSPGQVLSKCDSNVTSSAVIHRYKNRWKDRSSLFKSFLRPSFHFSRVNVSSIFVKALFILLVVFPFCPVQCHSSSSSFDIWENEVTLDTNRNYVVQWTPSEDRIVFRVTARTRGYIGFGFHDKPKMDGADIVVGWVHSGKLYLQDRYGKGNEAPDVDRQQDWDLIGGFENDTHTVLIMSRPFITCDPNDYPITNDTAHLLWAYHPDDPVDPESPIPRLHYHGETHRGSMTLFLLQRVRETMPRRPLPINYPRMHMNSESFEPPDPPLHSWSLVGPPATISASLDSVHWCRLFKRPRLSRKHHVVRYEPVLTGEGAPFVHHMMVYECIRLSEDDEALFGELAETEGSLCSISSMQTLLAACNHVVVAWALGSEGVWLPPEAGYPLTPEGPVFYMLETHYDISQEAPVVDSSGVRLLHTPVLRNFDAGVLSVGLHPNWKHIIPPRQNSVLSEGHCVSECTQMAFPTTGINVFGVIFHTHLLGRQVRLRHLRDDVEFEPLASDTNYDFTYQEYRALRHTRKVLPGDHLIGECVYNSEECSSITLGGFKTRDEMCLSFLFYYPKVDLSFCHSKPSLETVLQSLGIQELSEDSNPITIRLPMELAGKTLKWRLTNYDWENHFGHFQKATHKGTFNPTCRGHNLAPTLVQNYSYPNLTKEWKPHRDCERQKRKNKRRKKKGGRGRGEPSLNSGRDGSRHSEDEEEDLHVDEEDVMVDDETSLKLIERIDADPIRSFDVFMPVIGNDGIVDSVPDFKGVETANFGGAGHVERGSHPLPQEEEDLVSEFEQMERELEKELHKKHLPEEVFHTRERPHSSGASQPIPKFRFWSPSVFFFTVPLILKLIRSDL